MSLLNSLVEQIDKTSNEGERRKVLWRAYWLEREGKLSRNDYLFLAGYEKGVTAK